ncbi:MAG: hypothetical protein GY778_13630 [bacterium]|nr:hypothetical protein [bacterium]
MPGQIVTLAQAIVDQLNDQFSPATFTATRGYAPVKSLEELTTLTVTVVPKRRSIDAATRGSHHFGDAVDIGIQQKLEPVSNATIDAMIDQVEAIADHLRSNPRPDGANFSILTEIENDPIFWPDHLNKDQVFTSVLTATYRTARSK